MKKIKKLAVYFLCLTIVTGCISGCGGFASKSDEDLLVSSIADLNKAKSFEMNVKLTGKMSAKMDGETANEVLDIELSSTQFTEPEKAKIVMRASTDESLAEIQESYVQKEDDKYVIYSKMSEMSDIWTKRLKENRKEAINAAGGVNFLHGSLPEDASKYVRKEERAEGDKKYLVYEYKMEKENLESIVKDLMSAMGSSLEADELEMVMGKMGDVVMAVLIDRKAECISSIEMPLADVMNNVFKAMLEYAKQEAAGNPDEEELVSYMDTLKVEISDDAKMVAKYSAIDAAKDFTIPKEALEAKSEEDLESMDEDERESMMDEGADNTEDEDKE